MTPNQINRHRRALQPKKSNHGLSSVKWTLALGVGGLLGVYMVRHAHLVDCALGLPTAFTFLGC